MSMYGTYLGFSLPLNTLAALVASRPSVWPLASTTYHLRSIDLPLGTNVAIVFLPLDQRSGKTDVRPSKISSRKARLPMPKAHGLRFPPTAKQICSGEDDGAYPLRDPDSAGLECCSSRRACCQPSSCEGLNGPGPDLRHRPQAQHRTRFTEYVIQAGESIEMGIRQRS